MKFNFNLDIVTKLQIAAILFGVISFSTCLKDNSQKESTENFNLTINPLQPFDQDSITFSIKVPYNEDIKSILLYYQAEKGIINSSEMKGAQTIDTYSAKIAPLKAETFVLYYVIVESNLGEKNYIPTGAPIAPAGFYVRKKD